jgi:transposase InsO family protein
LPHIAPILPSVHRGYWWFGLLWVADLTYIRLRGEFVFLAIVLDAFSRKAIGWELGRTLETKLPLAALEAAIASRQPQSGLVHHSDRGTQYASNDYVQRLEACGAFLVAVLLLCATTM